MARVLGGVVLDGGDGKKDLITGAVFACLLKHHCGGGGGGGGGGVIDTIFWKPRGQDHHYTLYISSKMFSVNYLVS